MQPVEYETMHEYESWYWWYRARRDDLVATVKRLTLPARPQILDVGCGSGLNLAEVAKASGATGFGVDSSEHAAALWNGETGVFRCLGSANELPFQGRRFDVVLSADVIGCEGVDTDRALREMSRVLRPGGYLVLFAPAYQWMKSRHDAAVHSARRYTRPMLSRLVQGVGLSVVRATYRMFLLFPMIALVRMATKTLTVSQQRAARSDLRPLPGWLNRSLHTLATWEAVRLGRLDLPWGASVMIVARKEGTIDA